MTLNSFQKSSFLKQFSKSFIFHLTRMGQLCIMSLQTRTTSIIKMTKNAQIISNLRNIFYDINEKMYIGFYVLNGRGDVRTATRIVKYDSEKNVFVGKHGEGFRDIEDSLLRLLTATNPDDYEIKVEKSAVLYRYPNSNGMTNWRKLTFSVIR